MSRAAPTVALGVLCSVAGALPGLLRSWPDVQERALTLVGAVSLIVIPVGLWIRRARVDGFPASDRALLLGTALSSLPLALFGGVLKSTTHHRPLGGATFAVVALCLLAICIGLAFRFSGGLRAAGLNSPWRSLFTACCALSLVGTLALGVTHATASGLVDFTVLTLAAAACGLVRIPAWLERSKSPVALVASVSWALLLGLAVLSSRSSEVARSLTTRAPVLFAPLSWLGGGS